ncbi:SET domain-containing protein [Sistotremastrum niveocremeum HHB9708]|nr:SET domain-containing protein [Sistotremastrum niveocremeum HHB9708]
MSDLTELSDDEDDGGPNHRLIGHLPRAEKSAAKTYKEIPNNIYTTKHLGSVHFPPGARFCTCKYKEGDDLSLACGPRCVNRSCYIECVEEECRLGEVCQNQRLARKQFAPVEVVRTKWKGFGLRAAAPIPQDSLVYEYLGEVVTEAKLLRRMEKYARSGLKHIYLMQLQKGEYIDATRKGGIGRFANHSCNPNCDIQQWTVGDRLRMAIVAKRDIELNEELTFNYNVDHYGNDAQECHCGESNCTGTIGGTTQTVLSDDSSTDGEDNEAPPKVTKKPGRPRLKSRASSGSSRTNAEKAASPKSTHSSPSESRATRSMTRIPKQGNRSGTRLQKKK